MDVEKVEVTQADREAAADLGLANRDMSRGFADDVRHGEHDDGPDVQAFARHRLAALEASPVRELVEGIEKIRNGYQSQMKFCDIEPLPYYRRFVEQLNTLVSQYRGGKA